MNNSSPDLPLSPNQGVPPQRKQESLAAHQPLAAQQPSEARNASESNPMASMNASDLVQQLAIIINDSRVVMLTTTAKDGRLLCRPLSVQKLGHDGSLAFVIDGTGEIARDVLAFPAVNIVFPRSKRDNFTSATGLARLDEERSALLEIWHNDLLSWFPRGLADPGLAVLQISIQELSLWEGQQNRVINAIV